MRRSGTHINGDMMTLGHYMIIDSAFGNYLGLGIHTYGGCKPMIVGAFDMMDYLVIIPSSLSDGVLCDGIEVQGKYLV